MEFDFDHMIPILAILTTITIFLCGSIAGILRWSFNAKIDLAMADMEKNTKKGMDKLEDNIKNDIKELYSDKVMQAGTEKDIERLQGDVIELKKKVDRLQK